MKILNKLILTLILTVVVGLTFSNNSFAIQSWEEMKQQADAFVQKGQSEGGDDLISEDALANFAMPIAKALVTVATATLVIVTVIIGIQYSIASPNDKGKLKQKLIGLVVSAIVVFGAQGIWAMVLKFMEEITQ